jgi:hypothetical protein
MSFVLSVARQKAFEHPNSGGCPPTSLQPERGEGTRLRQSAWRRSRRRSASPSARSGARSGADGGQTEAGSQPRGTPAVGQWPGEGYGRIVGQDGRCLAVDPRKTATGWMSALSDRERSPSGPLSRVGSSLTGRSSVSPTRAPEHVPPIWRLRPVPSRHAPCPLPLWHAPCPLL